MQRAYLRDTKKTEKKKWESRGVRKKCDDFDALSERSRLGL